MTQTMGTLIVLLSTGMWGISGVCGQYLFEHTQIDSTWLIAVRQILAGLMYMMVIVQRGKEPLFAIFRAQRQTLWKMLFFTLGLLGSQYGFYYAIKLSNAPTATVLIYTAPVFVVLQQVLMQHRPVEKKEAVGIFTALMGVFLVSTHGNPTSLVISPAALFWSILSAIAMTLYTVAPAHILKEYSSPYLMGWGQLLSEFILLPLCNPFHSGVESWTFFSIGAMGYIIVFGTVVPFLMYFNGLKVIGPVKASLISCSEPLCSVLFSVAFLGTFLALPDYLGVVCIVGTVVMLSLK